MVPLSCILVLRQGLTNFAQATLELTKLIPLPPK
jgi:hypothetical protein